MIGKSARDDFGLTMRIRGVSSAGRAPALQAGGHRFDPGTLHTRKPRKRGAFVYRSGDEIEGRQHGGQHSCAQRATNLSGDPVNPACIHACPLSGRGHAGLHRVRHRSSLKRRAHAVPLTHGKPRPVSDLFGVRGASCSPSSDFPNPGRACSRPACG
jgi:hypothetical protein